MYRLCGVNNPFVISQNYNGDLKQCIIFREVANIVYSSLREKIFFLSGQFVKHDFYTWMMDKHTDIIIIVKDNIFLGHLTHLTNFHQYTIFATSRKKGRYPRVNIQIV